MFIDINECAVSNGGCTQECSNNPGSFSCLCRAGYEFVGSETANNVGRLCQGKNLLLHASCYAVAAAATANVVTAYDRH